MVCSLFRSFTVQPTYLNFIEIIITIVLYCNKFRFEIILKIPSVILSEAAPEVMDLSHFKEGREQVLNA